MKFGVVVFPGSNCDHDCYYAASHAAGAEACFLWHKERDLKGSDVIILPGGFSYGDYLRSGAMARFSPIMEEVIAFANRGGPVIGICNGFQILTESGLLPGALMRNKHLKFLCRDVFLRAEQDAGATPFTRNVEKGRVLRMPIAHNDGCYFAEPHLLDRLEGEGQVIFRYVNAAGEVSEDGNPNGSLHAIAGITNEKRNVLGLMPHPDRCAEDLLGNHDGALLFQGVVP